MMRSLYSAITGLKNHQTSMDIIGNNIANVNTAGYKRQRASFATMLGQQIRGASAPTTTMGGTNGVSIGLGSILGSVDKVMGQGSSQYTGKATDMMIQGEGMFVLNTGTNNVYTRVGNFDFDKDGTLINVGTGAKVQGYTSVCAVTAGNATTAAVVTPDAANPWGNPPVPNGIKFKLGETLTGDTDYTLSSYSIGQDGVVTGVYSDGIYSVTKAMFKIAIATFPNPGGLTAEGNNYYSESNNSGPAAIDSPGAKGRGMIIPNYLEMSNVDLSQEFTDMIVTQRGFQANSRVITVSDTLLQELIDLKRN
ncbi:MULTISPECIES: flagellar hook-basal body complex protein [Dehalobacter]|jgi:flagellar hook protein FlgE|uniref:Flagellar hook protein FlgE n=2 Tax=Dehalobacter restrictus TaxID=55583 RepID=A0A857DKV8_9FIRM|nr:MULTISPECIES: flagellar hook-basal body complex protein [Dehalobacter]AHF10595.1 flagellar hook protein FlgE [Dehalobacter restrictus DSM 9455]MCG1026437.1 flagellar hook-basal body complex protein [Dehalobacter sp.]MDJ0305979.1 flagellar hook-basal body complex protein [Dehalobacter sp.]OCZ52369.1 flagellar basal body rod protein FlgG [Dehalobacter sp. TeCB1]QHA01218.1 flagellar hook-basal body complex protein [Dehalobacter restrictus]